MIYPVDSAIQCLIKRGQLSMQEIFFVLAAPTLESVRESGESRRGGKGSPTLFITFVLVEGFISRVTFTANGKLRNSQIENEHIKTAQTVLLYKTGVNLLISEQLKWTVNDKLRETLVTWYIFTIAACRKRDWPSKLSTDQ